MNGGLLERWLAEVVATPGLTALSEIDAARRVLAEDALRVVPLLDLAEGRAIDVGSGGGSPGIPLAIARPDRGFTLLEASRRKAELLKWLSRDLPNVDVLWGRSEEQPVDSYGIVLAKALARPPVATELTLPLVRPGGIAILWTGETADLARVARVAEQLAAELETDRDGLVVLRKLAPTPPGFPRRPGMAKKRPLEQESPW
ncbi:MAG TPA: RsmG family class I SAM-dependent methyltransferase [Gaiellaceae bacterium]|nr:RsmG family class I SAM-dependent methyltransferase [Gaiellaceae bacterium]